MNWAESRCHLPNPRRQSGKPACSALVAHSPPPISMCCFTFSQHPLSWQWDITEPLLLPPFLLLTSLCPSLVFACCSTHALCSYQQVGGREATTGSAVNTDLYASIKITRWWTGEGGTGTSPAQDSVLLWAVAQLAAFKGKCTSNNAALYTFTSLCPVFSFYLANSPENKSEVSEISLVLVFETTTNFSFLKPENVDAHILWCVQM